ncbi:MAG: RNHCP domain-containing protein [Patescibacteria group bacterium]
MSRKDFKRHNEGFKCLECGAINEPAVKSERNHCAKCLYSLHVDGETPGDRLSSCGALMMPMKLDHNGKKGFMILHKCDKCDKEMWNRAAADDDLSRL